jgi:DNA-binding NarL/FixJ family response regulator
MSGVIRVLICDDAPEARAFVRAVLGGENGIEIVGEATDGATCLTSIALAKPDVVVLDLQMPGTDGFHVLEALHERTRRPRVLVYSSARDEQTLKHVRARGAYFLAKGSSPDALAAAVKQLA